MPSHQRVQRVGQDMTNEGLLSKVCRGKKGEETVKKTWNWTKSLIHQRTEMWKKQCCYQGKRAEKSAWARANRNFPGPRRHERIITRCCLNAHFAFSGKQLARSTACSPLLLGELWGVENPGAFSWQGVKRIIPLYLLHSINISLGLFCKNKKNRE